MTFQIDLVALSKMDEPDRTAAVKRVEGRLSEPFPATSPKVARHLAAFETKHGMSSAQLVERLRRGEIQETDEISSWLFWIQTSKQRAW